MEFIDNSLDSAEELYLQKEMRYKEPTKITVKIEGKSYRDGKVIVTDNCLGMDDIAKVVESVGYSTKKAQAWTNGQFGYGIYSFMAICSKLEIVSKIQGGEAKSIKIDRDQFDTKDDVIFPDPKIIKNYPRGRGTQVILSKFDKNCWKQLNVDILKQEIEKHFELLLQRKYLRIMLIDQMNSGSICKPFNYEEYDGDYYDDYISELRHTKGRIHKKTKIIPLKIPIHIFIKVTKKQTIGKNPVFISKGRRIGEIGDIKSFKSSHKGDLWRHPNVTGYIDVGDYLEPTIARNDFKNNDNTNALFNTLFDLESLIIGIVNQANKESEERHYRALEDRLNSILSKLSKIDAMNYRTDYLSGKDLNLMPGGTGQDFSGEGGKDRGDKRGVGEGFGGENEGEEKGPGGEKGNIPGGDSGGDSALKKEPDNPFDDTGFKGEKKKKSGFNIRIVDTEPDIDAETNKPIRSKVIGGDIVVFKNHEDFQSRVSGTHTRQKKITPRLISYLASEITVHYKDKFYCKGGQPDYNKKLFIGFAEFIYMFESMLKDLDGKNLSDIDQ